MDSETVHMEVTQKCALLTIDYPPANALSPTVRDELAARVESAMKDDGIWTVIISGAGPKFFMAGADIPKLLELGYETGRERVRKSRALYSMLAGGEKPVIAAINGICMGGGLELAMACDIRVAAEHAKLGLPEVNLGLIPGGGGTQRLPRLVGPGWANYLMFTGEAISAAQALDLGLVQKVVPAQDLRDAALALSDTINSKGPLAVRAVKRASFLGMQGTLEQGLDIENEAFGRICATDDKNEGVTAFLEKRRPVFQGK